MQRALTVRDVPNLSVSSQARHMYSSVMCRTVLPSKSKQVVPPVRPTATPRGREM